MKPLTAEKIIERMSLEPLYEEGGYYREVYRSEESIPAEALADRYGGDRCFGTSIYYLITKESFSLFHRLRSDEIFHFYFGAPVTLVQIQPNGRFERTILGHDLCAGHVPQCVVPKDTWQGLFIEGEGEFALLGTTVAPGFEFQDFERADRERLLAQYPHEKDLIWKLTRET